MSGHILATTVLGKGVVRAVLFLLFLPNFYPAGKNLEKE
jgi:hypothetical protein